MSDFLGVSFDFSSQKFQKALALDSDMRRIVFLRVHFRIERLAVDHGVDCLGEEALQRRWRHSFQFP